MRIRFFNIRLFILSLAAACCALVAGGFFSSFFHTKTSSTNHVYPVIIIGGGIGGLTAGLRLAQEGRTPLILEGPTPGGLLSLSHSVRNWPGIQDMPGSNIVALMKDNALKAGAVIKTETAVHLDCASIPYTVTTEPAGDGKTTTYKCTSVIIATGTTPRKLSIPGEEEYWGKGVSNCAVCDGGLYKNKAVAVIGGGEAALEEAGYLASLASSVTVIVRKPSFKSHEASRVADILKNPKVSVLFNTAPTSINGENGGVTGLSTRNLLTGAEKTLSIDGIFEAIGSVPNTQLCESTLTCLHKSGQNFIATAAGGQTNIPGVFAIGDVTGPHYRQAIMVAQHATEACLAVLNYLAEQEPENKIYQLLVKTDFLSQHSASFHSIFKHSPSLPEDIHPAIIVGGGAAGLTAAIYLGYAGYKPLIIDKAELGGSLTREKMIHTWPTEAKISGANLASKLAKHALSAGAQYLKAGVESISYEAWPYEITLQPDATGNSKHLKATCIILATGAPTAAITPLTQGLSRDRKGRVRVTQDHETSKPGVFAAGDIAIRTYKEPLIACGYGAEAALNVCEVLRMTGTIPAIQTTTTPEEPPASSSRETSIPKKTTKPHKNVPHLSSYDEFEKAIKSEKNVIIDCFAQWCPPCKALKPIFQELYTSGSFANTDFYAIDVDEAEDLAALLNIRSLPTLLFFTNGLKIAEARGFKDKAWLINKIETTFKKP